MAIETCPDCQKPFDVSEVSLGMPGTKEKEDINCPHCHKVLRQEISNGFFRTSALTPEQEELHKQGRRRN
jgi:endogenous inhibitor of DNA gyrase (YacG/DUF329 family)